ncbi:MAG TPA: YbgC/FadM family acyl-CoA thioesterase [Burkholderiaceae bacterium]|nr:YbgC/FadM family acyl-CoA thioesterase [Burkholderiaceae bacterium]
MTDARSFSVRVRVYYEDTDAGGIVYHANYLRWMERARTEWLRSLGARHAELAAGPGLQFVVSEMAIRWIAPARLDDLLDVDVAVLEVRRASMRLAQRVWRPPQDASGATPPGPDAAADRVLLAEATVRAAATDRASGRPVAMPRALLETLGTR